MRHADLSLTVSQRKLACVLDPALVLGHAQGPTLAVRLTRVFEAWLTRSFWQVIDSSEFLLHCSEFRAPDGKALHVRPDHRALAAWLAMRQNTDAGSWCLRWAGDSLAESQVRDGAEPDFVGRYESLLAILTQRCDLDSHASTWPEGLDPLFGALDTLALAASLEGALILSATSTVDDEPPWPVRALGRSGIDTKRLDLKSRRTLFTEERQLVRDALASAGLAAVVECLPRLAIIRLMMDVPVQLAPEVTTAAEVVAATRGGEDEDMQTQQVERLLLSIRSMTLWPTDPWQTAHAWWYLV